MDPYSTHLPVLQAMYKVKAFPKVFEFGCGRFSTPHFASNSGEVVSIEMQSHEWFTTMQSELAAYPNLILREALGAWPAVEVFKGMDMQWDLVFVDGHADTRWSCVNHASRFTNTIVAHDTESPGYGWDHIVLPEEFVEIRFKQYHPWTTIWTSDPLMINHFNKVSRFIEGKV
jgi:hypothetical protein